MPFVDTHDKEILAIKCENKKIKTKWPSDVFLFFPFSCVPTTHLLICIHFAHLATFDSVQPRIVAGATVCVCVCTILLLELRVRRWQPNVLPDWAHFAADRPRLRHQSRPIRFPSDSALFFSTDFHAFASEVSKIKSIVQAHTLCEWNWCRRRQPEQRPMNKLRCVHYALYELLMVGLLLPVHT